MCHEHWNLLWAAPALATFLSSQSLQQRGEVTGAGEAFGWMAAGVSPSVYPHSLLHCPCADAAAAADCDGLAAAAGCSDRHEAADGVCSNCRAACRHT